MIVWSGAGIIVLFIGVGSYFGVEFITQVFVDEPRFFAKSRWLKGLAFFLAAGLNFGFYLLLRSLSVEMHADEETGQVHAVHQEGGHSLFFIPVKWWTLIFALFGAYITFK